MPATILSAAVFGIDARPVYVEAEVHPGLPSVAIVGLPDTAVQEARERIRAAVKNSGFEFPLGRVTVNLSPADWRKEGSGFDVPVAVAILIASGQVAPLFANAMMLGEVSLGGEIRSTNGALAVAELAQRLGKKLFVPSENADEANAIGAIQVVAIQHLRDVRQWSTQSPIVPGEYVPEQPTGQLWSTIRGQATAKRAITIAAAGHHNILMVGPPGSGKTLLAQAMAELLPPMTLAEALEVTKIHSVVGRLETPGLIRRRPVQQPHHTSSVASLIGGGRIPKPGALSLAHRGILFLDEFPEFSRDHLEALRQPLEDGVISVSRVAGHVRFPAHAIIVAAMNPCPCGYAGDGSGRCHCSVGNIARYRRKISGPLIDRFDLHVTVPRVPMSDVLDPPIAVSPQPLVSAARARQRQRAGDSLLTNSALRGRDLHRYAALTEAAGAVLRQAVEQLQLSMRSHDRIIRVSRTIADLAGSDTIEVTHVAEALQYRPAVGLT